MNSFNTVGFVLFSFIIGALAGGHATTKDAYRKGEAEGVKLCGKVCAMPLGNKEYANKVCLKALEQTGYLAKDTNDSLVICDGLSETLGDSNE